MPKQLNSKKKKTVNLGPGFISNFTSKERDQKEAEQKRKMKIKQKIYPVSIDLEDQQTAELNALLKKMARTDAEMNKKMKNTKLDLSLPGQRELSPAEKAAKARQEKLELAEVERRLREMADRFALEKAREEFLQNKKKLEAEKQREDAEKKAREKRERQARAEAEAKELEELILDEATKKILAQKRKREQN